MFQDQVLRAIQRQFPTYRNPRRATGAFHYMKGVAPFLGIDTPTRRAILKTIFAELPEPTSNQLGNAALTLMRLEEREYHYAAYDLIAHFNEVAEKDFLLRYGEKLLTTKSWWDTVDGLGNAMVSPLTLRYPSRRLIRSWSRSQNIWLNRAAIQHQRGRGSRTEVEYVLELCQEHADSNEFFVTKAIGWALRDISRFNKPAVRKFLKDNPQLSLVAVREARRYL